MTPLEAHTGVKPNLSRLRVFGSRVLCKQPSKRSAKLDHHVYKGILIGFGATDKHVRYIDHDTNQEKLATHVVFDEAHYTSTNRPPGVQLLYNIGMPPEPSTPPVALLESSPFSPYPPITVKPFLKAIPSARRALLPLAEFAPISVTASAAKLNFVWDQSDADVVSLSPDRWDYAYEVTVPLDPHVHSGLHIVDVANKNRVKPFFVYNWYNSSKDTAMALAYAS